MDEGSEVGAGNKRRGQVRKVVRASFTAARRQVFLDYLAAGRAARPIRRNFLPTYRDLCHLRAATSGHNCPLTSIRLRFADLSAGGRRLRE